MNNRVALIAAAATAGMTGVASAAAIDVTIENTLSSGGFYFTPFWLAAHDGGFDSYDGGTPASNWPGLTSLAENGSTGAISAAFAASAAGINGGVQTTLQANGGGDGAPVFAPGESASTIIDVGDATINRWLSFASMVIPSNDLFVANGDPLAYQLFDAAGNFSGPLVIEIFGSDVNDNGTEVNDAFGDAAFSANDGQSVPEAGLIRSFFTDGGDAGYLASFIGTETAIGTLVEQDFGSATLIARITITQVPAPGALALFGLFGVAGTRRRRA